MSGSTTTEAACQLLESAERGGIKEGMLLLVESGERNILARVAQIVPYNDFYTEGDPWSEARRKNLPIPEDVARRYEVCKLDLLMEVPKAEVKNPPQPGDYVLKIDPKIHEKDIFGVSQKDPKHIWFGSLVGYKDAPVPLYIENIPMHMAIFGVTGSGKSFTAGALIEKLADVPVKEGVNVSYPMIIIDAHGDYTDYVNHVAEGKKLGQIGWIKRYVFPKAYLRFDFRSLGKFIQPIGINLDLIPQRELAEIIILFYKGTTEGAELQIDAIDSLFDRMKAEGYARIQEMFRPDLYFNDLLEMLEEFAKETDMHSATKGAIRRALSSFVIIEKEHKLLSTKSDLQDVVVTDGTIEQVKFVEEITKDGGIAIFDFSADAAPGVDLKTKQFVMTYLASLLFEQFTNYKIKREDRYLLFIIEEAQNFCPDKTYPVSSSLAHTKLSAIATQGRKFGLSLCLISQRPSFVDRIILSMCNSFFIHRVSPEDVSFVRSVSGGLPPSLVPKLTTMSQGDLILAGQVNTVPFPLVIHIPGRQVKHTVGEIKVCENLAKLRGV
ncbi:MAG: ATP-binding protein [Candidatus Methanomethylicaceae archaeon]